MWKLTVIIAEQVELLNVALSSNITLKELILHMNTFAQSHHLSSLIRDNRVKLNHVVRNQQPPLQVPSRSCSLI